jgi:LysR family transcriptional regulator, regulator for genes of the gallate degradation pathway
MQATQPELRHVRAFLAVVDQGSAHRAGVALFRAQSGVSRAIGKLETELGVKLFERRASGMLLTQYGRALLVRARRAQAEMQGARADLAGLVPEGSVRNAALFGMLTHERHLRAFVALAALHHMPSVAENLGVTQPAVSLAVRQIEQRIGVRLFERTPRGMIPSAAGAALALRMQRVLAEIRHAVAEIAALRGAARGTVTVGALPLGRTRLLPESIAAVIGKYPGLRIATLEGSFEALAAGLRAGQLDFIFGALRPAEYASDLQGEPLVMDELAIVARRGHPWAERKHFSPEDLGRARWVLPRINTPNRTLFERALKQRGTPAPDVVVETSDLAVLRGVLLNSDLLTATSARQLSYELRAGLLTVLPLALPDTRRQIGITRRTDDVASPGATLLMAEIARRCASVLTPVAGGSARGERRHGDVALRDAA